ncbi:MAG: hypothetical protein ACE5OS_11450 [Anaerolineae bacterium]
MRPNTPNHTPHWLFAVLLLLILLVAAGLRLYRLPELPLGLHYDEAANGILAAEIAGGTKTPVFISSYTGKEVLFFYWTALLIKLLGTTPLPLRLSAALAGLATVAATAWAVSELLHGQRDAKWIALLSAAFLATSFWHLVLSRYGFRAITQPLLQALTVAALWRGLRPAPYSPPPTPPLPPACGGKGRGEGERLGGGNFPWLLLAGLLCGLTAYTYLAARAFPIPLAAALLTLLIADRGHRRACAGRLALFVSVAALTLAPLARYWLTHPGSFLNRTQQVAAANWAAAWAGIRACLGMFFLRGDPYVRFNLPHRPLFDPITAVLFLLGLAIVAWQFIRLLRGANPPPAPLSPCPSAPLPPCAPPPPCSSAPLLPRPSAPLSLASCVFLLASIPTMLLPSALATGDVTPSNLRTVGLLPFIYTFPALGLWAILDAIHRRLPAAIRNFSTSRNARGGLPNPPLSAGFGNPAGAFRDLLNLSLVIVHWSLVILLLALSGSVTATTYFGRWAVSAELYYAADGDLVDAAGYLNQADLSDVIPYVASIHYHHPTLAFLAEDYGKIRWLTGGRTVVFPAKGEALLIFPRSASANLAWVQSLLPDDSLSAIVPGPDGAPAFHVHRVGPALSEAEGPTSDLVPTYPLSADLAHAVTLLGYDVIGQPRSGASVQVAVWWHVLTPPAEGNYGPVARLTDPWGFGWGETQPFHYPSVEWTSGEVVVDHLSIPVGPGAPPGDYLVNFSLYSAPTDSSLPVLDDASRYAGTAVELPVRLARAAAPPDPDDLNIRTRLDVPAGGMTLLGVNLDTTTARPGEPLYLTLFWRADDAPLPNYDVSLSLDDETLYTGTPVHGAYPTSRWTASEIVVDRYGLCLPRDAQPGDHFLRLRVSDLSLDLGSVTVLATERTFQVPVISHPLTVGLGSQVELLGYDLTSDETAPGETLTLTLYWRALTEMEESYTVFTHLLAPDGSMTGQHDSQPGDGGYPTNLWLAGEVITDIHEIPVRADASPGEHRLEVGMYVAETGVRLPVAGAHEDAIFLQTVTVTGP